MNIDFVFTCATLLVAFFGVALVPLLRASRRELLVELGFMERFGPGGEVFEQRGPGWVFALSFRDRGDGLMMDVDVKLADEVQLEWPKRGLPPGLKLDGRRLVGTYHYTLDAAVAVTKWMRRMLPQANRTILL